MNYKGRRSNSPEAKYRRGSEKDEIIRIKSSDGSEQIIRINHTDAISYYDCCNYDKNLAGTAYTWHLVIVHHDGKYRKPQIVRALFDTVGDYEFYPIAYRERESYDQFLIRQCKNALHKLFERNLKITISQNNKIPLTVRLNVAEYNFNQIYPSKKVEKAVERQIRKLETIDSVPGVLNLDDFASSSELSEIIVNLRNKAAFELLCKVIAQNYHIKSIKGIRLSNNNITSLSPLKILSKMSLQMLDLRYNSIIEVQQLEYLKLLPITDLYISGNTFTDKAQYLDEVKEILPNLRKLDGIRTRQINSRPIPPPADNIELEFPGDMITASDINPEFSLRKYKGSDMWHQVIVVHRGNYSQEIILESIYASLTNTTSPFFPCYYEIGRQEDTFLIRNCHEHIEAFIINKLSLKIIGEMDTVIMVLKMNVANFTTGHVDPTEAISVTLTDRYNLMDRLLDLESFHSAKALRNISMSFSSSAILTAVLIQAGRRYMTNVVELRLGNNNIATAKGMHALKYLKSLKVLNLYNNNIRNIEDLKAIPSNSIKEVRLDGNPLCKDYSLCDEYIKSVKTIFPEVVKLDGVDLNSQSAIPVEKNFLCDMKAYSFVEQFVTTFYNLYDTPQRHYLAEMYDLNALFSMSFLWQARAMKLASLDRLASYFSKARNLVKDDNEENIFYGRREIARIFKFLPQSEHDLYTFHTDVPIFNDKMVCIIISGVFREIASSILENDLPLGFRRTFFLVPNAHNLGIFGKTTEYKIINEQFHIQYATDQQLKTAFKFTKPRENSSEKELTSEDKEIMTTVFQKLTSLKPIWCTRCFTDAKWDFTKALEIFVNFKQSNKLPANAFTVEKP